MRKPSLIPAAVAAGGAVLAMVVASTGGAASAAATSPSDTVSASASVSNSTTVSTSTSSTTSSTTTVADAPQSGAQSDAQSDAQNAPERTVLGGTTPTWAAGTGRSRSAALSAQQLASTVTARVYLASRDQSGLDALARAVSDPRSKSFRHFLSAAQVRARFAPDPERTAAVRSWLASAGFTVTAATPEYLAIRGTAASAQTAFAAPIRAFSHNGGNYLAPAKDLSVPASVAPGVLTVTDLGTAPREVRPADALPPPEDAFVPAGPFSSYYGSDPASGTPTAYGSTRPWVLRGYDARQLRTAYGVAPTGLTGKGATIAIVDAYDSPTIKADAARYAAEHGDAPWGPGQLTQIDDGHWTDTEPASSAHPTGCDARGWYGEQTLDIEAAHGMAPDANIVYLGASSCNGPAMSDDLQKIVDQRLADIVSCSWGSLETDGSAAVDKAYDEIFEKGAVEGIGFDFASGDDGDDKAATGTKQVSEEPSLPWVTAVGGTSLATDSSGAYRFEKGWGNNAASLSSDGTSWTALPGHFSSGAGGGTSRRIAEPWWQRTVVPQALTTAYGGAAPHRVVPDVASLADPDTGFLVGQTQTFPRSPVTRYSEYRIGGTSLATPLVAGFEALAQQAEGQPLGFANPLLYAHHGTAWFNDVTDSGPTLAQVRHDYVDGVDLIQGMTTELVTGGRDSSLKATPGYDDVTGLGTPTGSLLSDLLSSSTTP